MIEISYEAPVIARGTLSTRSHASKVESTPVVEHVSNSPISGLHSRQQISARIELLIDRPRLRELHRVCVIHRIVLLPSLQQKARVGIDARYLCAPSHLAPEQVEHLSVSRRLSRE